MTNIAVIYYSSTGTVHTLAGAIAEGAREAGAEVRLRRVAETAPRAAIEGNEAWKAHADGAAAQVTVATNDDLEWADGLAFGTPTRFGNVSSQLKSFLDATGGLWAQGKLADKAATAFTSAANRHGGNESTLLSIYTTMNHWGCISVPPGYTDPLLYAAGGNPHGTAYAAGDGSTPPGEEVLAAARYQGARLAKVAALLAAGI